MPEDPLKKIREINQKYGIGVSTPTQADTLELPELQTGVLSDYAPQSEESKKFEEAWNQKGGGAKFRTGIKAGWENMKGGVKNTAAEVIPYLLAYGPGANIPSPDLYRYDKGIVKMKESAEKNFEAAPEGKGFLFETGQFIPQIVGTMTALAAAPVTGGTSLSAIPTMIGTANIAVISGMVLGQTLHEYDQYTAENGIEPNELTRWSVAMGAAAAEFAAEKFRLGRLLPDGLVGKVMGQTLKMKPELADDMMRKWAKNDPKAFGKFKKFAKTTLLQANEEGMEEFATEFVQSYLNNIYLNPEDKLMFNDVINNSFHAYKGGVMMGGMLGPASYTSNQMYHKMRRNRNGATIVETSDGSVYEYLGADPKDKSMATLMDSKGKVHRINRDHVVGYRHLNNKELTEYLNVYKTAQDNLPQMEEQMRINTARQHVDGIGRNLLYQGEGDPTIMMGRTKDDNYVFIRTERDDGLGKHYIVVDPETMSPSMISAKDITETFPVDYDTWLEGEVEQMIGVQDQQRQEKMAGETVEEELKEEAGLNDIKPGEKVIWQGREWMVSEVGVDGSLSVEEVVDG